MSTKSQSIEIADYLFANPMARRADLLTEFGKKWHLTVRTLDRRLAEATIYNKERIALQSKAKDGIIVADAIDTAKKANLSREQFVEKQLARIEELSRLQVGDDIKVGNIHIVANYSDKVRWEAEITKIWAMLVNVYGFNAPIKTDNIIRDGFSELTDDELEKKLTSIENAK